jgi:hypothetical protein
MIKNEGRASVGKHKRRDSEAHPIDHLGNKKERSHVDAKEAPEIPGRQIDNYAIAEQDERPAREKGQAGRQRRAMKPCTNQGITSRLQRSRRH